MDALKSLIRDKLRGHPTVARLLEDRPELSDDPGSLLKSLEELGVVEEIYGYLDSREGLRLTMGCHVQCLQKPEEPRVVAQPAEAEADLRPSSEPCTLGWQLCQAFLDYLEDEESAGGELSWHLAFGGQRLHSRPVPAAVAPKFDEAGWDVIATTPTARPFGAGLPWWTW
eukprot:g29703.t1